MLCVELGSTMVAILLREVLNRKYAKNAIPTSLWKRAQAQKNGFQMKKAALKSVHPVENYATDRHTHTDKHIQSCLCMCQ